MIDRLTLTKYLTIILYLKALISYIIIQGVHYMQDQNICNKLVSIESHIESLIQTKLKIEDENRYLKKKLQETTREKAVLSDKVFYAGKQIRTLINALKEDKRA